MPKTIHRTIRKLAAALLAAVLLATCAGAAAYSSSAVTGALGLSDSAVLQSGVQIGAGTAGLRENVVTYTPARDVLPVVAYGTTLYGRSAITASAQYLAGLGYTVVAGVNAAFFDMNDGIPYGLVVTDGVLRSSGNVNSVGFFDDGTAVIGKPGLSVRLTSPAGSADLFYNKALTDKNGIGLYSNDYDYRTKSTLTSYNLVLEPSSQAGASLSLNGSVQATVAKIVDKTASCDIPAGCFVLSVSESSVYQSALTLMKSLRVGDAVTIDTSCDAAWQNVLYACGGGELLVENGTANTAFTLDTAKKQVARTAVGLRGDGSLILYTADYGSGSAGLTLPQLAARMADLGCVTALNLDGGGSTAMGAHYPGWDTGSTVNQPSDGSLRKCANFIFLVRKTQAAQDATRLYLYPYHAAVLAGAQLEMTAKAADDNYTAAALPDALTYSASGGSVSDKGVFTADAGAGSASVTVTDGLLTGSAEVTVIDVPTSITIKKEGSRSSFASATVAAGSTTELTASALYYGAALTAQDTCFTWSVSGGIGTIDSDGTFVAAQAAAAATGSITASCGSASVSVAVTVSPANPFADMDGHWAKQYVNALYFDGVLTGSIGTSGKLIFRPDDSMTRQEFLVSLIRFLGTDTSSFTSVKLPFDDASKVASWAQAAVQTAYSLGYIGGSSSGGKLLLNPTDTITRQEAMVILARSQSLSSGSADATLAAFSDASKVASWAQAPLAAMVEQGVISGSNGKLNPTGDVTRAEIAKMLSLLKK